MSYYSKDEDGHEKPPQFYAYQLPFMQPPPPQRPEHEMPPMTAEIARDFHHAKLRNMHANARGMETKVMLDGMRELRDAIAQFKIDEGDKGGDNRPPLEPGFDEINMGKLQNCYLRLAERFLNYVDHTIQDQLKMKITNEVKKQ